MILVAIDPGLNGAAAMLDIQQNGAVRQAQVADLPTMGTGKQRILNGAALRTFIMSADRAVVEIAQSFPGQGIAGTFRYGTAFGQVLGVLQALDIPYDPARPSQWKRVMGLQSGRNKSEYVRRRALELFPKLTADLARKMDHNRAEALLLAQWWLEYKGKKP